MEAKWVAFYLAFLKRAIKNREYVRIFYRQTNGWQVQYTGRIVGYDDTNDNPFVTLPSGEDRKVYINKIKSLTGFGKPDYPY